jgi:lysozyme
MKISKLGLNLVRHFEGMYLRGYKCPANVWTIGFGHTGLVDGKPIHGNMVISEEKAIELLQQDMAVFENAVKDSVKVPLTQNQFDALVSFAFNVGAGALRKSTLLRLLNQGKYEEVPAQFLRWNKGGGKVLAGLTRRRKAEGHLFVTGELKTQF